MPSNVVSTESVSSKKSFDIRDTGEMRMSEQGVNDMKEKYPVECNCADVMIGGAERMCKKRSIFEDTKKAALLKIH